ncbi:hypothetical protein [Terrabacter sp. 2YAF2]|uniref:hypothetical protein n=1 Tax=Terrabacter sp. 2YAF2 TaxID=3233026 RepID=UPI003F996E9B
MGTEHLTAEVHRERAERHAKIGHALADSGDEWAAVCFFYSAYHRVKAALLDDVVFDDPNTCYAKHVDLLPQDRYTSRHKGRKHTSGGREWGINDLVLLLYRGAAGTYDKLHQMSIDVRYQSGLRASIPDLLGLWSRWEALCDEGTLGSDPVAPGFEAEEGPPFTTE